MSIPLHGENHCGRTFTNGDFAAESISESLALSLPFPQTTFTSGMMIVSGSESWWSCVESPVIAVVREWTSTVIDVVSCDAAGRVDVVAVEGRDMQADREDDSGTVENDEVMDGADGTVAVVAVVMRLGAEYFAFFFLCVLGSDGDRERLSDMVALTTSSWASALIFICAMRSSSCLV